MAPFESTDHGFINSTDDITEGTTNQYFTQARAQASFQVSNRPVNLLGDQAFDGVTYLFGGLDLSNGIITYIPPNPINLSAYATTANLNLKVNNQSSIASSVQGKFLKSSDASGTTNVWSYPSLNCGSFALTNTTSDFTAGNHHTIEGDYTTLSTVGSDISNNNDGTFTIMSAGVYQIHFTLAMSKTSTGSFLRGARCTLLKGTTKLVENHFFDSVSEMHEVFPSVNYVGTFAANDVITLQGQSNLTGSNFKALGQVSPSNSRTIINFIRLG